MQIASIHTVSFDIASERGFRHVFGKYYPALVFFANRLLRDIYVAEDVVANTFVKLWEKRSGFASEESVKAFLYITTRNACFNASKSAKGRAARENAYIRWSDKTEYFAYGEITRAEALRFVDAQINELPKKCRRIMRLRLMGKTNEEIAAALNLSPHTVKNQYQRGISLLRQKLKNADMLPLALIAQLFVHNN